MSGTGERAGCLCLGADLNQSFLHCSNTPSQCFEFRFNFLVMSFRELKG